MGRTKINSFQLVERDLGFRPKQLARQHHQISHTLEHHLAKHDDYLDILFDWNALSNHFQAFGRERAGFI